MTMRESPRDAAQAVSEYVKGRSAAVTKRTLAVVLAIMLVVTAAGLVSAAGTVVDDFESGDLSEWDNHDTSFGVTSYAHEGDYALRMNGTSGEFSQAAEISFSDGTTNNVSFYFQINSSSSDGDTTWELWNGNDRIMLFRANNGDLVWDLGGTETTIVSDYPTNEWMFIKMKNLDYANNEFDIIVEDSDGNQIGSLTDKAFETGADDVDMFRLGGRGDMGYNYHVDYIGTNGAQFEYSVTGTVTYASNGSAIEGASISVNNSDASDTTDANGDYTVSVADGEDYEITATKSGASNSTTVSVSGSDVTGADISLKLAYTISGTVKNESGGAIEGATVSINSSASDVTTDANGSYSFTVGNGTYEVTADKSGFESNTTTVTVSGADEPDTNITLSSTVELVLEAPSHMWQNQTADYIVWDEAGEGRENVTANATVTSADPTNVTVHEGNATLESTSNLQFSGEIKITASYGGETVSKNVTVANKSVENVDLMQQVADMTAALWGDPIHPETGDRQGGDQLTMRVLFIAVLLGAAIVPLASAFAGIGMTTLVVAMGWFMGWVGDGMALVTVFTGLFIGLNVAANIDYSVRR